jgi:hypothetical protein
VSTRSLQQLREQWQAAWPQALAAWSRHLILRAPQLCLSDKEAAGEGLSESFAMIRLVDQAVVVNLHDVRARELGEYAPEILAHEIGHHVLAPANLTDHARALARIRRALPTLETHAPMISNLFTDLLINDRLQRSAGLRLAEVFRKLSAKQEITGPLWRVYVRTYELLWSLERGALGSQQGGALSREADGDAWLVMRIVRHYARNWLEGAPKFAMLMLPYLAKEAQMAGAAKAWHDTRAAGAGGEPSGLAEAEDEMPLIHPSLDPELTGATQSEQSENAPNPSTTSQASNAAGQDRQPFEFGEILRAAGVTLSDHDLAVAYYREKAAAHLIRFPARKQPRASDPMPEGLEPWQMGESFDSIDWMQSILQSPRIIPGMTTVQRVWGHSEGRERSTVPMDLDVYIDSSGSMPNPQQLLSFPTLAGAILCMSALRAGASVKVTVWSGKQQETSTPGFLRDQQQVLRTLITFYGGGTQFPLPVLRETYLGSRPRTKPTHILVISDDGVTTMFDKDERGNEGWDLLRASLASGGAGATFVLNLSADWENRSFNFQGRDTLIRSRDELGVHIHRIDGWEQLVQFARDFARRAYEPGATTSRSGAVA